MAEAFREVFIHDWILESGGGDFQKTSQTQ